MGRAAQSLEGTAGSRQTHGSPCTPSAAPHSTTPTAAATSASGAAPAATRTCSRTTASSRSSGRAKTRGSSRRTCCGGRVQCRRSSRLGASHSAPTPPRSRPHAPSHFDARDTWSTKSLAILPGFSYLSDPSLRHAGVVKLVDALDSKSCIREDVSVRVRPPVPSKKCMRGARGSNRTEEVVVKT